MNKKVGNGRAQDWPLGLIERGPTRCASQVISFLFDSNNLHEAMTNKSLPEEYRMDIIPHGLVSPHFSRNLFPTVDRS
jgi:hypothetical protein